MFPASDPSSPNSVNSVAHLKTRIRELGLEVPNHAVEKDELRAIIEAAEKRATTRGPPPTPQLKGRSVAQLKSRIRELGFEVPTSIVEKSELVALVAEAERQKVKQLYDPCSPKLESGKCGLTAPAPWVRQQSRSKPGQYYYVNSDTGEKTWEPWPWFRQESRSHPGTYYYVNAETSEPTWEPPLSCSRRCAQTSGADLPSPDHQSSVRSSASQDIEEHWVDTPQNPTEVEQLDPPQQLAQVTEEPDTDEPHDNEECLEPDSPNQVQESEHQSWRNQSDDQLDDASDSSPSNVCTSERLEARGERSSCNLYSASGQPEAGCLLECTKGEHGVKSIAVGKKEVEAVAPGISDGTVCGSRFTWIRQELIGRGSLGRVFKAIDKETGQAIAVKEVPVNSRDPYDVQLVGDLENEVKIMSDLKHSNIVSYLGHDFIDNCLYLYMEYMLGGSMTHALTKFGAFGEALIADYSLQLLAGLEYLHTRTPPVVHRDIKSSNILVGLDNQVKLADFGCSKRLENTMTNTMRGSIPWMAPEVLAHSRYGRAADIWSFGCVVIEMGTANIPWGRFDNQMAAVIKIGMSQETPPLPEKVSEICRDFIRRCVNRDPDRRSSTSELLDHEFVQPSYVAQLQCADLNLPGESEACDD